MPRWPLAFLLVLLAPAAPAAAEEEAAELNGFPLAGLSVPRELTVAGGPPRDGIRSVDEPHFASVEEATWVDGRTVVLGVALGGEARAYPEHVLDYHQIVNDVVGGAPVVAAWDPIAGVPRAYRRVLGGRTLTFGVSGLLHNSSFLMFDRETESLWLHFTGEAVAGELRGKRLEPVTVRQEIFDVWRAREPETRVLDRPMPRKIDYRYSPFQSYWVKRKIPFPVKAEDDRHHPKEVVVGLVVDGHARAYLGSVLTAAGGRAQDTFQGKEVLVDYDTNVAAFAWDVPEGVEVTEAYWFAWKAFHPETEVWEPSPAPTP